MERRHFEFVARRIKHRLDTVDTDAMCSVYDKKTRDAIRMEIRLMAQDFSDAFAQDNPRFDYARFLVAAGVA
jgi:hypothetical protein